MSEAWLRYELWQGGICVAATSGPATSKATLHGQIMHYAMQYAQDGQCEVRGPIVEQEFADDFDT